MKTRTYKFVTNKEDYSLFNDLPELKKALENYMHFSSNSDISINAHITVITKTQTKIKFRQDGEYQDMMSGKFFDSDGYDIFSDVIIQDTGVVGELTLSVG